MNIKHEQKRPFLRGEEPTVTLVREVDGVRCRSGQMRVEGYAASIIGTRAEQQDSCVVLTMHPEQANDADTMLAVVCDGIGGFAGGKEASTIAVSSIIEAFQARASVWRTSVLLPWQRKPGATKPERRLLWYMWKTTPCIGAA